VTRPAADGRAGAGAGEPRPSRRRRIAAGALGLLGVALLLALGVWQVERRAWKLALMDSVEQRVHAEPVPAPGPDQWPLVTAQRDAYRRVTAVGRFIEGRDTRVRATTGLGRGFWILTPLRTGQGYTVLVNRGFVPTDAGASSLRPDAAPADPAPPEPGTVRVTGLLRASEPGGAFLQPNDPARDQWYSRDVAAIAAARGLDGAAPYFVDREASPGLPAWPRAGMTVLAFPNNHLLYAIIWFGLALALSGALVSVWRNERQDGPSSRSGG